MWEDWRKFLEKSKKKKFLPESFRREIVSEFIELWEMLMHNEFPTMVAAEVCANYPEHNVAEVLDRWVIRFAANHRKIMENSYER